MPVRTGPDSARNQTATFRVCPCSQIQRRISSFIELYRFGMLWAFQASLELLWGDRGFSIIPNLRMQQLVMYLSAGFEVFWKF